MLAIGCDKEVVIIYLPNKSAEYFTRMKGKDVNRILAEKHRYKLLMEKKKERKSKRNGI